MKDKDKDFDKVMKIMRDEFNWRGEVGDDIFTYTNEIIKATKISMNMNDELIKKFLARIMQLGVELERSTEKFEDLMIMNDATLAYKEHIKQLKLEEQ